MGFRSLETLCKCVKNQQLVILHEWKFVKTTCIRFPEVYNARKQGGILGLNVPRCGNSWKPPMSFPEVFNSRNLGGILRLIDCFQMWKPSGNNIGVSPKWKLGGNYCMMSRFVVVSSFFHPVVILRKDFHHLFPLSSK